MKSVSTSAPPQALFGDKRLESRSQQLLARMVDQQSVIINQLGEDWKEQISFYRFLHNDRVKEASLLQQMQEKTRLGIDSTSQLLVISDTSLFDYSSQRDQIKPSTGLGYIGDHQGFGYNGHVSMAINASDASIVGLSDVHLWHREQAKKDTKANYYHTPLEEKESYRWIHACQESKSVVSAAAEVTYIHDSEGDMYDSFVWVPESGHHLFIRSKYDRRIRTMDGEETKLRRYLSQQAVCVTYEMEVRGECGKRTAHTALLAVRYGCMYLQKVHGAAYHKAYPEEVKVWAISVQQCPESVPPGEKPIHWILLTTHPIEDFTKAVELIYWYTLRWLIEEFFRLLKKKGFQVESAQLESGYPLRRLGLLAMNSAIQIMQLRQAREGSLTVPIEAVFAPQEVECLEKVGLSLEGKSQKLTNPHPTKTLPWASWIIARLGGWKGYKSQRPPGVITFSRGMDRFKDICIGNGLNLKI